MAVLAFEFQAGSYSLEQRQSDWKAVLTATCAQGFTQTRSWELLGYRVLVAKAVYGVKDEPHIVESDGSLIAVAIGPVWFDQYFGSAALQEWLKQKDPISKTTLERLRGEYQILAVLGGQMVSVGDSLGLNKLYRHSERGLATSGWLNCAALEPTVDWSIDACQAYIVFGSSHSEQTPIKNVLELSGQIGQWTSRVKVKWSDREQPTLVTPTSFNQAVDSVTEHTLSHFKRISRAYNNRIRVALTAGFDSRMIVAACLASNVAPEIFTYGTPVDQDVEIATEAARAIGIQLETFDKGAMLKNQPLLPIHQTMDNLAFFDGLPLDGAINSDVDRITRLDHNRNGSISLNGGGGEIMRNFFYLPDRSFTVAQLYDTFYPDLPHHFKNPQGRSNLRRWMIEAIQKQFSTEGNNCDYLKRDQVELLYANFRCRFWMGRNNTVANRYGPFMTPLFTPELVEICHKIPIAWKNDGRLQAAVINNLNPTLAKVRSSYGFAFSDSPSKRARALGWLNRQKPTPIRPLKPYLRRMLSNSAKANESELKRLARDYAVQFDDIFGMQLSLDGKPEEINRAATLKLVQKWLGNLAR
jgi:hypothetical protein